MSKLSAYKNLSAALSEVASDNGADPLAPSLKIPAPWLARFAAGETELAALSAGEIEELATGETGESEPLAARAPVALEILNAYINGDLFAE